MPWQEGEGAAVKRSQPWTAVRVRAGDKPWRSETVRRVERTRVHAGWRAAFHRGLLVGMSLGCLAMVVFHAVRAHLPVAAPGNASQPGKARQTEMVPQGAAGSTATDAAGDAALPPQQLDIHPGATQPAVPRPAGESKVAFAVPGIRMFVLCVDTAAATSPAMGALWGKPVIYPVLAGHDGAVAAAAMRASDLTRLKQPWQSHGVKVWVTQVVQPAFTLRGSSGLDDRSAAALSDWLAAGESALRTLLASLMDGAPSRDAWTAYNTSRRLLPGPARLARSGYGPALERYSNLLTEAYRLAAKGRHIEAVQTAVAADAVLRGLSPSVHTDSTQRAGLARHLSK